MTNSFNYIHRQDKELCKKSMHDYISIHIFANESNNYVSDQIVLEVSTFDNFSNALLDQSILLFISFSHFPSSVLSEPK